MLSEIIPKDKIIKYVNDNPQVVLKGTALGIISWYTIPIVVTISGWLPFIGASYYLYNNLSKVNNYKKSWFDF